MQQLIFVQEHVTSTRSLMIQEGTGMSVKQNVLVRGESWLQLILVKSGKLLQVGERYRIEITLNILSLMINPYRKGKKRRF